MTSRSDGAVIGQLSWGLSSLLLAASVTETANSFLPTSTATTTVEDVTGAAPHFAAEASPKPWQSSKKYTAPAGLTNVFPQQYLEQDSDDSSTGNVDGETIGGGTSGSRKTKNRVMVKAEDVTGRPVALTLYWFDHPTKPNRTTAVCGGTSKPLAIDLDRLSTCCPPLVRSAPATCLHRLA